MPIILRLMLPFALGYWLSYVFRVINAVAAPAIMTELQLDAATLGLISSTYFLTFAACQIPLGILLDRYQTRTLASLLLCVAAAGSLLFGLAESSLMLWLGRGLIGIGVSACLMAAFKTYVTWLKPEQLPMINGLQLTSGGLGALCATVPVEWALTVTDWRTLFIALALLCLAVSLLIRGWIPLTPSAHARHSLGQDLSQTWQVIRNPGFYQLAPASMLSQSLFVATQSLWAGEWLRQVNGLSATAAADILMLSAIGMVVGFLSLGTIAGYLLRLGISTMTVSFCGMLMFLLSTLWIQLEPAQTHEPAWILFGFFGTSGTLMFAGLSQTFPKTISGRVSTSLNLGIFLGAFVLQWGMGVLISLWTPLRDGRYPTEAYQTAFAVGSATQALSLIWYLLCRRRAQSSSAART